MNLIAVLIALAIIIVAFKFNVFLGIAVAIVAIGVGIYNFLPTYYAINGNKALKSVTRTVRESGIKRRVKRAEQM